MRFRGEVQRGVVAGDELRKQFAIADVALHECQPRVVRDRVEVGLVTGVGQLVEHGHLVDIDVVPALQQGSDVVRADEPSTAGDEKSHELICTSLLSPRIIRCARWTVVARSSRTCRPINEPSMRDSPSMVESSSTIEYATSLDRTTHRSATEVNGPM